MKKTFFLFFFPVTLSSCLILFFLSVPSFADTGAFLDKTSSELDKASSELIYNKTSVDKIKNKRLALTAGFHQINGFIISADHISQLFFTGVYRFKNDWSVALAQFLNRHYFLNPNSNDLGLWIQDTELSINKKFTNLPYKSQLSMRLSSTLPLSYYSQINDILTVGTAQLNWSLNLNPLLNLQSQWIKNLTVFINPVIRYYVSLYTTTPTLGKSTDGIPGIKQSIGGSPLPEFLFGIPGMGVSIGITDYFSLSGTYGRWVIFPYKTGYARDKSSFYEDYYHRHYYLFSLSGSWQIKKDWTVSLSYSHVDRLDRQGRMEMVLFDDRISSWFLSTSYSFFFDL